MSQTQDGMKVVILTYSADGWKQGEYSFHVDDDSDVINEMDKVENHLFNEYEQFLEGDRHE